MIKRLLKIIVPVLMLVLSVPAIGKPPSEIVLPCTGGEIRVKTLWEEDRYQGATAKGLVQASPEILWRIITDHNNSHKFMPNIIESKTLRREGNMVWTRTVVNINMFRVKFFAQSTERKDIWELSWKQLKGPFTTNHGKWVIEPAGSGSSMVTYQINLDHTMMPEWVRHYLIQKSLPRLYRAIRDRARFLQGTAEIVREDPKQ